MFTITGSGVQLHRITQKHRSDGKTPEITVPQARGLLASIDLSTVVGLRDRAVLGTLVYTGARVGALARLRGRDLQDPHGAQRQLRFLEKNGKDREIPVRHDLEEWLLAYLAAAAIPASSDAPLFQGYRPDSCGNTLQGLNSSPRVLPSRPPGAGNRRRRETGAVLSGTNARSG